MITKIWPTVLFLFGIFFLVDCCISPSEYTLYLGPYAVGSSSSIQTPKGRWISCMLLVESRQTETELMKSLRFQINGGDGRSILDKTIEDLQLMDVNWIDSKASSGNKGSIVQFNGGQAIHGPIDKVALKPETNYEFKAESIEHPTPEKFWIVLHIVE